MYLFYKGSHSFQESTFFHFQNGVFYTSDYLPCDSIQRLWSGWLQRAWGNKMGEMKSNESSLECMRNTGCAELACGTEHRNRSTQSWSLDREDQVKSKKVDSV